MNQGGPKGWEQTSLICTQNPAGWGQKVNINRGMYMLVKHSALDRVIQIRSTYYAEVSVARAPCALSADLIV